MNIKNVWLKRMLSFMLIFVMVFSMIPMDSIAVYANENDTRVADPSTKDSWMSIFGADENGTITTENAGRVWTDKSVFTEVPDEFKDNVSLKEGDNSFLVSLSAMASTTTITGMSSAPTDTMIILDLSSSMYPGKDPSTVQTMVEAVNDTIKALQEDNEYNRVGVSIYFGGGTLLNATSTAECSKVLLPIGRYTHESNNFLKANVSNAKLTGISVNSEVTVEGKTTSVSGSHSVPDVAGTFTQLGILDAMNQFLDVEDTTITVGSNEVTRVPIFVLMSDGEPTAATNEFTEKTVSKMGNNRVDIRNANETDFVTQLTAAYARKMVDDHYVASKPLFYTLSLGNSISEELMDPSNHTTDTIDQYWNDLVNDGSVDITVQNCTNGGSLTPRPSQTYTVSKEEGFPSSVSQREYVDQAFTAETADDLQEVFSTIVHQIQLQSQYYPTLVESNEDMDGYVSFVDKIGQYMSVTDVTGLYIGNQLYSGKDFASRLNNNDLGTKENPTALGDELMWSISERLGVTTEVARTLIGLAYNSGQLSYTSDTEFSNYIGWYSDANGKYVGFWSEETQTIPENATHINRSYLHLGAVDEAHGVKATDMMHATIRVRQEIATGEETIAFAIPAALIPVINYNITLDIDGNISEFEMSGAQHPIRLLYEVSLDEEINELTVHNPNVVDPDYVKEHTNSKTGEVYFYTNQYEVDGTTGYNKVNTYSYFEPSRENEKYYYQADATVYVDQDGTPYEGDTQPDGTYYRTYIRYEKDSDGNVAAKTIYRQLSEAALDTAKLADDGTWYIPKGNVHVNMDGFYIEKSENKTETLGYADTPFVDVSGHHVDDTDHRFVVGSTLGNNGRIAVLPTTGLAITKNVTETHDEANAEKFEFTITNEAAANIDYYLAKLTVVDGKEVVSKLENGGSFDSNGVATVTLSAGETIYLYGLTAGIYKVTEGEEEYYIQTSVTGYTDSATETVTLKSGEISQLVFTNTARGNGELTITKQIRHELGTSYHIPDKTFNMTVTLSGAGTAGKTFTAKHSGNAELTSVTTDAKGVFTVALKHNEQIEIFDLPEGATATVVENLNAETDKGFTVSYEDSDSNKDGVVTIVKDTVVSVVVANTYTPDKAPVNIEVGGTKYLVNKDNAAVTWENETFEVVLEKYDTVKQEWVEVSRKTVDKDHQTYTFDMSNELYTEAGEYAYQIYEVAGELDNMYYDTTYHTFHVTVADVDMDGALEIKGIHSDHADKDFAQDENGVWIVATDFTNKYTDHVPVELTTDIQKIIENASGSELPSLAGYEFGIYADAECTEPVTNELQGVYSVVLSPTDVVGEGWIDVVFDEVGTYTYYIKEIPGTTPGMSYSDKVIKVEITVSYNEGNKLVAEAKYDTASNENGEYEFTNKYELTNATVNLDVNKTLSGRKLNKNEFTFVIKDSKGNEVDTATNNKDGKVVFQTLEFSEVGIYDYTVDETSEDGNGIKTDTTIYDVQIVVSDDGKGALVAEVNVLNVVGTTMTFENHYTTTPADVTISGTKVLEGRTLVNDEFTFELYSADKDGNIDGEALQSVKNAVDGKFEFDKITYDTVGAYYYVVSEKPESVFTGVTYDTTKYLVKVEVTDNEKGTLEAEVDYFKTSDPSKEVEVIEFVNTYKPNPVSVLFEGIKSLTGRDLEESEFTFTLFESSNGWQIGDKVTSVANAANGTFAFKDLDELTYDEPGTYYYIIAEEVPEDADDDHKYEGIVYDINTFHVKVSVTDNDRGSLMAEVDIYDGATGDKVETISFNNLYVEPNVVIEKAQQRNDGEVTKDRLKVESGDEVTYYVTVENVGKDTAKNVVITDEIPAGLTLVEGTISDNGTEKDRVITWNIGDLAVGESKTVTFTITVPEIEKYTEWVNIAAFVYDNPPVDPENPVDPEEPTYSNEVEIFDDVPNDEPSDEPNDEPVLTGDTSPIMMWFMLLFVSGASLVFGISVKKKEEI